MKIFVNRKIKTLFCSVLLAIAVFSLISAACAWGGKKCGALCAAFFRRHGAFGFHGHVFIFQGTKQNHGKRYFADPGLYIGRSGRQDRMRR